MHDAPPRAPDRRPDEHLGGLHWPLFRPKDARLRQRESWRPDHGRLCHRGRDPRRGPRPQDHRRTGTDVRSQRVGYRRRVQHDGLGRPDGHGYLAYLRDGGRDRGPSRPRGPRVPVAERLSVAPKLIRGTINNPASLFAASGFLFLFALLFFSTIASAQSDLQVQKIVFNVTAVEASGVSNNYLVDGNLTWLANYPNNTAAWHLIPPDGVPIAMSGFGVSVENIPGRPGWLTVYLGGVPIPTTVEYPITEEGNSTISVGYENDAGDFVIGCPLNVFATRSYYECGAPKLPAPPSLTFANVAEYPPAMGFQLRHPWTTTDALLENISYEYQTGTSLVWSDIYPSNQHTTGGIVYAWFNTTDWETGLIASGSFRIRAKDNLTSERSEWACALQARIGDMGLGPYSCIGTTDSFFQDQGNIEFPMADVPGLAAGLGLNSLLVGAMLIGIAGLGITLMGYFVGGVVGAFVGASASLAWAYVLNILPAWGLILAFLGCAAVVAITFSGGKSE